jgi:hypothetical protein
MVPIVGPTSFSFTASGFWQPFSARDINEKAIITPLTSIPSRWALQVTGLDNSGNIQAPTVWDVILQASLDGFAFTDNNALAEHSSEGGQSSGDMVWSGAADSMFKTALFIQVHVRTLNLGPTATKLKVSIMGV